MAGVGGIIEAILKKYGITLPAAPAPAPAAPAMTSPLIQTRHQTHDIGTGQVEHPGGFWAFLKVNQKVNGGEVFPAWKPLRYGLRGSELSRRQPELGHEFMGELSNE